MCCTLQQTTLKNTFHTHALPGLTEYDALPRCNLWLLVGVIIFRHVLYRAGDTSFAVNHTCDSNAGSTVGQLGLQGLPPETSRKCVLTKPWLARTYPVKHGVTSWCRVIVWVKTPLHRKSLPVDRALLQCLVLC